MGTTGRTGTNTPNQVIYPRTNTEQEMRINGINVSYYYPEVDDPDYDPLDNRMKEGVLHRELINRYFQGE